MSLDTSVKPAMLRESTYSTHPQPSSSSEDQKQMSKLILKTALQKANVAVQCDSKNDIIGAIDAYQEAIDLLEQVLVTVDKPNDRLRLQEIYDSYSERVQLLTSITQKITAINHTDYEEPDSPIITNSNNLWQDNNQLSSAITRTRLVSEKELTNIPVSLPNTPQSQTFGKYVNGQTTPVSSNFHDASTKLRSCSISSADSEFSDENSTCEQPSMALPSLRKKEDKTSKSKPTCRARTTSLPKHSLGMQRSSSISTVESAGSYASPSIDYSIEEEEEEYKMTIDKQSAEQGSKHPISINTSQPAIASRPFVVDLGSLRRRATNRVSADTSVERSNSIKTVDSPASASTFSFFMKDSYHQGDEISSYHSNQRGSVDSCEPDGDYLSLLLILEKSMIEGAHMTHRLYIPKNLWLQPSIKLPSMDIKVSACETISNEITRLEKWSHLDDLKSSIKILEQLENSVDQLQITLAKKLKSESLNSEVPSSPLYSGSSAASSQASVYSLQSQSSTTTVNRTESTKKGQSFMSWGNKLTKSVERMNAFSLTKPEYQFKHYTEALQKLFTKIHVLERWLMHYTLEKRKSRQPQHDILISKLIRICTNTNNLVGGFVVRDITILLEKWLKRGGSWVSE
ncbi:hypothetical protein A0J61_03900 [Choanephora cucurbitarum]|uniref:MIT domain-containing protein n=1 Tax=Choanephora cucurbitarum TaxID=101091 RepID=A0A1C7NH17_9FUNG|nr:hypothetical protein A0J61_03900 [Choanephora cucurbitarum]